MLCIYSRLPLLRAPIYRDRIQQGLDNTRKTGQSGGPGINGSRLYTVSPLHHASISMALGPARLSIPYTEMQCHNALWKQKLESLQKHYNKFICVPFLLTKSTTISTFYRVVFFQNENTKVLPGLLKGKT